MWAKIQEFSILFVRRPFPFFVVDLQKLIAKHKYFVYQIDDDVSSDLVVA